MSTRGLFCEWGYVVDFDRRALDVYVGFRNEPASEGEWAGGSVKNEYGAIQRIASYPFDALPEHLDEDALSGAASDA